MLKLLKAILLSTALALLAGELSSARAQALSAASQRITLSLFGGATGTYTGLLAGRNAAVTAGADFEFLPGKRFQPSVEIRGSYPVDKGAVDAQKNILAGFRVSTRYRKFHPYADVLGGRGQIDYLGLGVRVPGTFIFYTESDSTVLSGGGGVDYEIAPHIFLKLDGQLQRYVTPVTVSGYLYAKTGTFGAAYEFHHHRPTP